MKLQEGATAGTSLADLLHLWFKVNFDRGTMHHKFDSPGVQTNDFPIMIVHLMSLRRRLLDHSAIRDKTIGELLPTCFTLPQIIKLSLAFCKVFIIVFNMIDGLVWFFVV